VTLECCASVRIACAAPLPPTNQKKKTTKKIDNVPEKIIIHSSYQNTRKELD